MSAQHVHVRTERTPKQLAELRAVREYYQTNKPSLAEVLRDSDQDHPMTLGEFMLLRQIAFQLKQERERRVPGLRILLGDPRQNPAWPGTTNGGSPRKG